MTADYRLPKRELHAEALVLGQPRMRVRIFLGANPTSHTGYERPSDVLADPATFLPILDDRGVVGVIRRQAVLAIGVPLESEIDETDPLAAPEGRADVTTTSVELTFDSGEKLRGKLAFVQPPARRRLGDYLNDCGRFFLLRDGGTVYVVNKARVGRADLRDRPAIKQAARRGRARGTRP